MSRCFPFPPPGYERKIKADDSDVLKKEKSKEKKHKKEKKDKEKKEGKDKREKERSDEKHKDKKDKKDKHRDKRKDKEKDRDKDKHKNELLLSVEKKVVGSADSHAHNLSEKSKEREVDKKPTSAEKSIGGVSGVHNGMPISKNNHQLSDPQSFKNVPDLGRKCMDEERRTTNLLPDKNVSAERKQDGGFVKLAAKSGAPLQDSKERIKEKAALDGRMDSRGILGDARSSGTPIVQNSVGLVPNSGVVQNRVGGIPRPVEKKIEQKVDGKEKVRQKEGDDNKGDKRKEKNREKPVLKDKDKDRDKEKKKEEIVKATPEQKHIHMTKMKDGSENLMLKQNAKDGIIKKDISGVQNVGIHSITKDGNHHAATVFNNNINHNNNNNINILRKRKDPGLNGIYDEHVTGPNKLARTTASSHPLTENGRSLEPCQNAAAALPPATQRPPPMNHIKVEQHNLSHDDTQRPRMKITVDGKECKINGTIAEPCTQSSRETAAKAERKPDVPAKPPPHPDTKYLSQVLSVPKMDEWSDFVNEEWLFNSDSSSTKKPEAETSGISETPQVWARALWLEQVDVFALPYVIPR